MTDDPQRTSGPVVDGAGSEPAPSDGPEAGAHDGEVELTAEPLPTHEEHLQVVRERDGYLDALQRMKADFDNFRKRMERERVHHRASAAREVVLTVLPVLDNLERAVAAIVQRDAPLADGVEMVRGQLASVLGSHGLTELDAVGAPFDPTQHEAIASVPSADHPEGTVIEVVEKGYRAGDDLVRAAKVVVAAAPPAGLMTRYT